MKRHGFTLVELMVTIGIMVVLSVLVAVTMGNVAETARVDHTRAEIARLHTLLMDRYESYRWRRLPAQIPPYPVPSDWNPKMAAQARCDAIRELMRIELPDRWTDISDSPVGDDYATIPRTSVSLSYLAAYNAAGGSSLDPTYQGADCLYWIVTMGLEENDVLENFSQSDIGPDPKNPKCLCFLDSWGNPIQFLRWAPGFISPLQPADHTDRDQTDPTGVYGSPPQTFALYPLILSAGPDGFYDITLDTAPTLRYSQTVPPNNPFTGVGTQNALGAVPIGPTPADPTGQGAVDNVTNQAIGQH